jgi:putative membrane protein insertion efficiency factor
LERIEFDEAQLSNMQQIGQELFADPTNPANFAYKRILVRPTLKWTRIIAYVMLLFFLPVSAWVICGHCNLPAAERILVSAIVLGCYVSCTAKKASICCVRIYQRYAPDVVRNRCRFEPSCSQYMILAIEKYGVIRGIAKGIGRLKRCNVHSSGYDYP